MVRSDSSAKILGALKLLATSPILIISIFFIKSFNLILSTTVCPIITLPKTL